MVTDNNSRTEVDNTTLFLRAARSGNLGKVIKYLDANTDIDIANSNGLNALHLASKDGHVAIVTELLKRGAKVDAATKKGNTALHIASLAGQVDVVNILTQHGATVNTQSQNGFTPLYMAAQENHDDVVKLLLSNGANANLATEDGFTPLAVAMQQGHDKVVSVLLENDFKGKIRLPALHIAAKKDDCKAANLLLQNDHKPDITSKSGFTPLHIAAHYGNEEIGQLLIKKGADVNYLAKHNISPLHVAAKWGKNNIVKLLLKNSAIIDTKTRDGLTPLHCAARSGHEEVVSTLLEHSAPISAKTKNGLAPLHMASQGDHVDAARVLLYHRAPVDEVTIDYLTSLHVAAHCGHVRVAKLLLDRKADPNARALNGFTPLHIACKKNRLKVVELLLKHGASIGSTTESGLTPLHVSSFMGCMNIVIFLLQHEANPDVPTIRGETPLHLAARANQTDIIRILLRNGAKVDARAREDQTPLHIAARLGNIDIVMLLLQHGAEVDTTTKDMYTALHIAAKEGQEEVAAILVENQSSVKATTKNGFTPLHIAAKYGNINVAKILLQKDSNINCQDKNDVTPLHLACHYDHLDFANMLLENGALLHLAFKNGHTALHIAARKNQIDLAVTLLEHGAYPNVQSKAGITPLHLSAQKGYYDMTSLLIEHGADPNSEAKDGLTALHLCAQQDFIRVASILVKNGANIECVTESGYRPLHIASHFGHTSMIKFLLKHNAKINVQTKLGYTPLHQAAQQGHVHIVTALLEENAPHTAKTTANLTPLNIAQKLGYISVIEVLKGLNYSAETIDNKISEEKYKVIAPESYNESCFISDSEDEVLDGLINEQPYRYLTLDLMKNMQDDSLPIDVTRDDPSHRELSKKDKQEFTKSSNYCPPENFDSTDGIDIAFFVSFLVDARGGTMKGCRHSGIRILVPPKRATMPIRVTCKLIKISKVANPPLLMEGEALATRIIEMGPVGVKFLGPVLIDVPHFASIHSEEREIKIFRSESGEIWKEHDNIFENDNTLFHTAYDTQMYASHCGRIVRIMTSEFPQYFAIVSRIKQEVHVIGADGGILISSVVNHVQAVFPPGALTKKIKVGLQAHIIPIELTAKLLGNCVAVSPVITIEPRRRKFHKPITLTIPVPEAFSEGMINQYEGETPTLRLLCSIAGGVNEAQWEDVTGSTPLTFFKNRVSFTTTVSARFWLMDCRNVNEISKMATELYKESLFVPFITNFVIYTKQIDMVEATLRILCMTDGKDGLRTLERQEDYLEIVKSRDVEVLDGKEIFLEFSGNLIPVKKSGQQLKFTFKAFCQNRLSFCVKIKDPLLDSVARLMFMRNPQVIKGEPAQHPICVLNIVLPEFKIQGLQSKLQLSDSIITYASFGTNDTSCLESTDADITDVICDRKDVILTHENQTYFEKLKFWEDITKRKDNYKCSVLENVKENQSTANETDTEYFERIVSNGNDVLPNQPVAIEKLNFLDMSECTVAEKAHYFEEQIQKEVIVLSKIPIKTTSQNSKKNKQNILDQSSTDIIDNRYSESLQYEKKMIDDEQLKETSTMIHTSKEQYNIEEHRQTCDETHLCDSPNEISVSLNLQIDNSLNNAGSQIINSVEKETETHETAISAIRDDDIDTNISETIMQMNVSMAQSLSSIDMESSVDSEAMTKSTHNVQIEHETDELTATSKVYSKNSIIFDDHEVYTSHTLENDMKTPKKQETNNNHSEKLSESAAIITIKSENDIPISEDVLLTEHKNETPGVATYCKPIISQKINNKILQNNETNRVINIKKTEIDAMNFNEASKFENSLKNTVIQDKIQKEYSNQSDVNALRSRQTASEISQRETFIDELSEDTEKHKLRENDMDEIRCIAKKLIQSIENEIAEKSDSPENLTKYFSNQKYCAKKENTLMNFDNELADVTNDKFVALIEKENVNQTMENFNQEEVFITKKYQKEDRDFVTLDQMKLQKSQEVGKDQATSESDKVLTETQKAVENDIRQSAISIELEKRDESNYSCIDTSEHNASVNRLQTNVRDANQFLSNIPSKRKIQEIKIQPMIWTIDNKKIEVSESTEPSESFDKELDELKSDFENLQSSFLSDKESNKQNFDDTLLEKSKLTNTENTNFESRLTSHETTLRLDENEDLKCHLVNDLHEVNDQDLIVGNSSNENETMTSTNKNFPLTLQNTSDVTKDTGHTEEDKYSEIEDHFRNTNNQKDSVKTVEEIKKEATLQESSNIEIQHNSFAENTEDKCLRTSQCLDTSNKHIEEAVDAKANDSSTDTYNFESKKQDISNTDLSTEYSITILDQAVKRKIAEVKECLEAAKHDLIEELGESSQSVIQIKDSPSEFQFRLQSEFIPDDIPYLYETPPVNQIINEEEQISKVPISSEMEDYENKDHVVDSKETSGEIRIDTQLEVSQDIYLQSTTISQSSLNVKDEEDTQSSLSIPPERVSKRRQKRKKISKTKYSESEGGSSSGESSNYQSCDYESESRPSSLYVEAFQSAPGLSSVTASEYETALMSMEHLSGSKPTSQEYRSAESTFNSQESMKSLNSLSSGHIGNIDNTSELSETLIASESEIDKDDNEDLEEAFDESNEVGELIHSNNQMDTRRECNDVSCVIPSKMKRSSEMLFQHVSESTEFHSIPEKSENVTEECSEQSETEITSRITFNEEKENYQEEEFQEISDLDNSITDIMSDRIITDKNTPFSNVELDSIKKQSVSDIPNLLTVKPAICLVDNTQVSMEKSYLENIEIPSSSLYKMSIENESELKKPEGRSPDSDSFEIVDNPDMIDDFVIVEEVGKEANEFDAEGKSISIKTASYETMKQFDREVENLITDEKKNIHTDKVLNVSEVFDFESEESPPQAFINQLLQQTYSDDEMERKKWMEMQFRADSKVYDIECDRGPLEDIKEEEMTDFEPGSSKFGSLGSHKGSLGSSGSMKGSCGSTVEFDILAGKKLFARSIEHDNISMSSLQEFENIESAIIGADGKKIQCGSQDSIINGSFPRRYIVERSSHGDDVSVSSLKDFEGLEKACKEAHMIELRAKEEEDLLEHESPENRFKLENLPKPQHADSSISFNLSTSGSDDYEKRIMEIDEIIRIAQANVEKLDLQDDTTEDISQIDITDTEKIESAAVTVSSTENKTVVTCCNTACMETSTDSLELEKNIEQQSFVMNRSSDSLDLKTTIDLPSLSYSDSLNNVHKSQKNVVDEFEGARHISPDSLEAPISNHSEEYQSVPTNK